MEIFEDLVKDWLVESNQEQCRWAFYYLGLDKGLLAYGAPFSTPYYHVVVTQIQLWENNLQGRARIANMKAAWRQKKFRKNNPLKTPYSFFLKKSTKRRLAKLAAYAGLTQNELLEQLICNSAHLEEERQRQMRKEVKEIRLKASNPKPRIASVPKSKADKLERDLNKAMSQMRELQQFCENRMVALAEATAKLEMSGLLDQAPTSAEDKLAVDRYSDLQASMEKLLKR